MLAVPVAAALVGCGEEPGTGTGSQEPSPLMSEPGGGAPVSPSWDEARDYTYTLEAKCGERALAGTYRVTVADGRVSGWEPVGENYTPESVEVPSILGLLEEAEQARESGADTVDVERTGDGRPTEITIDYDTRAMDDEACYWIRDYQPEPAS
jgi:hypothetical protein